MPVDTRHPHYSRYASIWQKIRDVTAGEDVVKAGGQTYLRQLAGMKYDDYADYLDGARFNNFTGPTLQGLLGSAFRVPPTVEVPQLMEDWMDDITLRDTTFEDLAKQDVEDKLQTGRYGLRIDMSEEQRRPFIAPYTAENITYWREGIVNGKRDLTMVVMREVEFAYGDDEFEVEAVEVYHVLDLDERGFCRFRIFRQLENRREWVVELRPAPNRFEQPLTFIPFVFDGGTDSIKPPLTDLANTNLGHYKLTADYYDAIRFTSKPQPWIAGLTATDQEFRIGSRYAWTLPIGATTGYLEHGGQGIPSIRQALIDDESRMNRQGAAVIQEPREGVMAAETARIEQAGKTSVLTDIVGSTGQAFTKAFRIMAWWGGLTQDINDKNIKCTMNTDFIEARMSPADVESLVRSWQLHGISQDTLVYNIKRGGLLPEEVTIQDEIDKVNSEVPPQPTGPGDNLDQNEEPPVEQQDQQEAA